MPSRDWMLRITDIIDAVTKIQQYTHNMTFNDFAGDQKTVDAVVRNIEIIGEAARHVPEQIRHRYAHMPWDEMRAVRNVVAHEYFGISLPILWETIQQDLPPLLPMLKTITTSDDV